MKVSVIKGKRLHQLAFRFGFRRSQVIYLIAGALIVATSCSAAYAKSGPPDWDKVLDKGNHYISIGDYKDAVEFFSSKLRKYPESGACHTGLGRALKGQYKKDEAKAEFLKSTQVEPGYADGFYELGCAYEYDKQYAQAIPAFERYLVLKPDTAQRKAIEDRIHSCHNNM